MVDKIEMAARALCTLRGHDGNEEYAERLEEATAEMEAHFDREAAIAMARRQSVTAKACHRLREKTGGGLMECQRALLETWGDETEAVEFIRRRGQA